MKRKVCGFLELGLVGVLLALGAGCSYFPWHENENEETGRLARTNQERSTTNTFFPAGTVLYSK